MRPIDLHHLGREKVICCVEADGVLIDPGPQSCEETLVAALGGERPRAVLLTHIHFDHAGASGALVRRWPDLPVYVHEKGAPHMADPERLVKSATRLYGEDGMQHLWGDVVPVPEENLRVLGGGERSVAGAFTVEYTPGHASHHVSYLHESEGWAYVGDVGGVHIPPSDLVVAPTPPPDIDIDAWERSLETVAGWDPERIVVTHFGVVDDPQTQLAALREALHHQARMTAELDLEAFVPAFREHVRAHGEEEARALEQAAPFDHIWLGLTRWRERHAESAARLGL
jgi:glyoxylase-like metal-dependent hydrolase (beta-lactamase superfamily II)